MSDERVQQFTISSRQRTLSAGISIMSYLADSHYQTYPLNPEEDGAIEGAGFISVDTIKRNIPANEEAKEFALI